LRYFEEIFPCVEEFGLLLVTLQLVVDVACHFGHIGMHSKILVLVEAIYDFFEVFDVVFKLFLLDFHLRKLLFGVTVQDFTALGDGVQNVFRTFEHNPTFVDIF